MLSDTLKPISENNDKTVRDIINDAINGKVTLFTIIKKNITVFYDYVEVDTDTADGQTNIGVAERDHKESFSTYDTIPLPLPALKRLWVDKKLEGEQVDLIFSPPSPNHKISAPTHLDTINLCDVYIDTTTKPTSPKKSGPHASYILAINEAVKSLGKNATNEAIYNWIKAQKTNPPTHMGYIYNTLDFDEDDDEISPYTVTSQAAVILKYNNKPITKKTFQNKCSEAKQN